MRTTPPVVLYSIQQARLGESLRDSSAFRSDPCLSFGEPRGERDGAAAPRINQGAKHTSIAVKGRACRFVSAFCPSEPPHKTATECERLWPARGRDRA